MTTPVTLGERLDAAGRALAARVAVSFPWAGPLRLAAERALALADPLEGRFDRIEVPAGGVPPVRRPAHETADPRPLRPAAAGQDAADPGRPLPGRIRARLHGVAGTAADAVRVHDDAGADALARRHGSEAVTVGPDVHFRAGRFRPDDDRGFALLAHEATHVAALLDPGSAWRRATGGGRDREERQALARERAALSGALPRPAGSRDAVVLPLPSARTGDVPAHVRGGQIAPGPAPAPASPPVPPAAVANGHAPAAPVMRAAEDRDLTGPESSGPDLAALRRDLLTALRDELRTEFERGG